jgi:two-component system cell cycle sensor histidine kinase/response regulator CckA
VLAALGAPTRTELEFPVRRPDGQPRWLSLRTYPPPAGAASDAGLAAVTSDVTERRQLQAQLARAQKLEALGLLASGVAHDFNNLLTVVLANASLVEETTDRRDVEELTGEITRAAQRASGLTRQLLLYSRREAMEFRPLDLRTVVEDLTRMLRRLVREDVAIAVSAPPEPQPVVGDPGMLEQVVVNLVVNARDALPRGGSLQIGTRTVALSAADAAARGGDARVGVWVVLSVRDDGLGIPGAVLPRLFEPFFTTKEAGMGTGLGLALVLQVTRQHGGWVEVRSVEGAGSTFEVFLPAGGRGGGACRVRGGGASDRRGGVRGGAGRRGRARAAAGDGGAAASARTRGRLLRVRGRGAGRRSAGAWTSWSPTSCCPAEPPGSPWHNTPRPTGRR